MNRLIISTCAALAFAVGLAAQTPAPAGQTPAKPDQAAAADKSITLKGCLRAGDAPDTYVLANAAPTTETAGTAGGAATIKGQDVRLIGSPAGMNLKEHVGHTVEATGTIAPQSEKSSAPAATPGAPAAGAAGAKAEQRLNVKTMKHVETKC